MKSTFWELFHEARKKRLPIASNVYELSARKNSDKRKDYALYANEYLDTPIHPSYVAFYNNIYSEVQRLTTGFLKESSGKIQDRAHNAYSFRLSESSTVKDLLATDVFRNATVSLDIPVQLVVNPVKESDITFAFLLNSYHHTLHWPQATEFLFLHELIVGYLGNLIQHDGELPARGPLPIVSKSYWTMPAYIVRELAIYLKRPETEVVALHFQTNDEVKNALPKNIQDLLLVSAHFTQYLDLLLPTQNPATILEMIYTCFFAPTLENLTRNPHLQLREDAGMFTDEILCHVLSDSNSQSYRPPAEIILRNMFVRFAETLWV